MEGHQLMAGGGGRWCSGLFLLWCAAVDWEAEGEKAGVGGGGAPIRRPKTGGEDGEDGIFWHVQLSPLHLPPLSARHSQAQFRSSAPLQAD